MRRFALLPALLLPACGRGEPVAGPGPRVEVRGPSAPVATGEPFPTLVTQWQLANYLDHLPGFTPASPRLQYRTIDLRATYAQLNQQLPATFPRVFPLVPDSTRTGTYRRTGTLRDGSGRHLRIIQAPSAAAVNLQLTDSTGAAVGSTAVPRIGIVRIR